MNRAGRRSLRPIIALAAAAIALAGAPMPGQAQAPASRVVSDIDLSRPFGAPSGWRFVALQAPPDADPVFPGETAPGKIRLCLDRGAARQCDIELRAMAPRPWAPPHDVFEDARYLKDARVVYPRDRSGPPLLLVQTASVNSGDSDQLVYTQLFAYRRASDRFVQVYGRQTGRNNNQEVRYIASGPLAGGVVVAEPTEHSPYVYWITVSRLTPAYTYEQVLRYRSTTGYRDGNGLAVIDSEMPGIEERLGLWRPGLPLPLPQKPCPKPRLTHLELWCG